MTPLNGDAMFYQGTVFGPVESIRTRNARNMRGMPPPVVNDLPSIFGVGRDSLMSLFDPRRNIDDECGYPDIASNIPVEAYRQLYDKFSIANRLVQVLPKESWQVQPEIVEDENSEENTEFEQALDDLETVLQGGQTWHVQEDSSTWQEHLLRADILSGIGHFGVLLLIIDDGRDLSTAVDGVAVVSNDGGGERRRRLSFSGGRKGGRAGPVKTVTTRQMKNGRMIRNTKRIEPPVLDPMMDSPYDEEAERMMGFPGLTAVVNAMHESDVRDPLNPHRKEPWKRAGQPVMPPLNKKEEAVVAAMKAERDYLWERHQAVVNARYSVKEDAEGKQHLVHNATRKVSSVAEVYGTDAVYDKQYSLGFPFGLQGPADASMSYREAAALRTGGVEQDGQDGVGPGASKSSASPAQSVPYGGTNPYSGLFTYPGLAPSGTDQQYFGVQFGPSEAMGSPSKRKHRLLGLRAFDESLVQVVRYEWNIRNPRFAQPVMYRITLNDPKIQHTGVGLPMATVFVHWSRVIHVNDVSEHPNSSEVFSNPRMQSCFNDLLDLRKMYGADGEAMWRNAIMKLLLSTHPQLGGDVELDPTTLRNAIEDFFNSLQPYLALTGMGGQPIAPAVVDPTPHVDKRLESICIKIPCPVPVFKGYEIGEQASENNEEKWYNILRSRQRNYVTPRLVVPFIDRLIYVGVLPEPEQYKVVWPELESLNSTNKAANALTRAQAMNTYASGNVPQQLMSPHDFLTRELGYDDLDAESILDNLQEHIEEFNEQQDERQQDMIDQGLAPDPTEPPPALADAGAPSEGGGTKPGGGGGKAKAPPVVSDVSGGGK